MNCRYFEKARRLVGQYDQRTERMTMESAMCQALIDAHNDGKDESAQEVAQLRRAVAAVQRHCGCKVCKSILMLAREGDANGKD